MSAESTFLKELHVKFIKQLDDNKDELEYWTGEHLRLSGVYWALTALDLMHSLEAFQKEEVLEFVLSCLNDDGGFGGFTGYDSHLLYTLSGVQILATYNALDRFDKEKIVEFVSCLQDRTSGAFRGDKWGEVDTRFSYCALSCLSLLGRLDAVDVPLAVNFIDRCKNFDGGYGNVPGSESHAGQIFCCVGALSITKSLHLVDADQLGWWLAERQLKNGGLNGRPEKLEDVCYSWWVLSSLAMLDRIHWISKDHLRKFILSAQDEETGGIADRAGDYPDVFHTVFGVAGLSLLGDETLKKVDPRYCMPVYVTNRLGLGS
ncbi:hypothetical protein HK097_002496 [Rhizophlyctis rosea]|uniref:Geranylgeranyl transferase type-2 subunit beta n=1 Tax=Rhizophlyctis rosea TaxID=64517 RepID=A0AAD5X383_9FUNG|nr:hypothetical protein HK097_002496 [Rhizophlyctis rosea]